VTALLAIAGAAIAAVVLVGLRRPALGRIALRSAIRRKGETVLVILGSLLGTAIITGSLIVGDTLDASIRVGAPNQLGPVDLVVRSDSPQAAAEAARRLRDFTSPDTDGALEIQLLDTSVATTARGDARRAEPRVQLLELDFPDATTMGGDAETTGISGDNPGRGEVVLTRDLAEALDSRPGDDVVAYVYGRRLRLTVDRVLPRLGLAGFSTGQDSTSRNAFVAVGSIRRVLDGLPSQLAAQVPPPQHLVLVSAAGGVFDGADSSPAAAEQVEAALEGVEGVRVDPVKEDLLEAADEAGDSFQQLFLAIGSFAVLAGVLLLVNIFVMLADERKSELGMLRAVGLKRSDLVRLFVVEGALYATVSAAFGALVGIGVGRVIVTATGAIFAAFGDLELTFSIDPASIVIGFVSGLLIALATVLVTSLRTSRVNIIRAIRDLPDPIAGRHRARSAVALVGGLLAGGAGTAAAVASSDPIGALLAPTLVAACLALLLARVLPRRPVVSLVAAALLAWAVLAERFVGFEGGDINVFVVQGVVLTAAAVALLSFNQETVGRLLRSLGGRRNLVARLGTAYPLARRFRTGITLATFTLVIFTLVFISVLSSVFGTLTEDTIADEAGGYDLLASSAPSNPLPERRLRRSDGVAGVATLTYGLAEFRPPGRSDFDRWPLSGVPADFVATGPPTLSEYDTGRFDSEREVWEAVLHDPTLMVADAFFLQDRSGPPEEVVAVGDRVDVRDPASGQVTRRNVVALSRAGVAFSGVMVSRDSAGEILATAVPHRYYLATEPGTDRAALAADLQGRFVANGLEAEAFRAIVEVNTQTNQQFFQLMRGYLALGLLVGIAGLGVVMVRAVRERRREVGMLRSLGLPASKVRATFLLESGFVAVEGMVVGTLLALVTSWQIIVNSDALGDFNVPFAVPWGELAILLGAALLASLVATVFPASQAARIKPAVALRIAD
jgi:putative ABC transport system permease protein